MIYLIHGATFISDDLVIIITQSLNLRTQITSTEYFTVFWNCLQPFACPGALLSTNLLKVHFFRDILYYYYLYFIYFYFQTRNLFPITSGERVVGVYQTLADLVRIG